MRALETMNSADIVELGRLYESGRLVLCVGPDLSRQAGLATPLDLARQLASHLRAVDPHGNFVELERHLAAGQDDRALGILRHRLGAEEFIRRTRLILDSAVDEIPELARLIAGVAAGLRAVYTTNLDRLLERAFGGRWWAAAQGQAGLARRSRIIVKLFGTAGRPETWVLTAREYERAYGGHDERRAAFEAVYRTHVMVFIGFDDGPAILRRLLAAVAPALAGDEPPTHFWATNTSKHGHESRREFEERGLRMVSSEAVHEWLRELARAQPEHSLIRPRLAAEVPSPYPGLEPYTQALADFFHGRDEELARAVGLLGGEKRWLSVEGSSGVGKSSFVRAGLVRAFEQGQVSRGPQRWSALIMRPGKQPLLELATELCRSFGVPDIAALTRSLSDEHGLSGFLREHVPPEKGLLLVVDQLEELVTIADKRQSGHFGDAIADALADDGAPFVLVTTLRSDFVGEFTNQAHGLARIFDTRAEHQVLRAMSEAELREVIMQPARMLGVELEHRLPERILQDVNEAALPLIAHVMRGLWDDGGQRGRLTLEAYERLGGVSGAVTRSADHVLEPLSKLERERAREMLLMLVNVDGEGRDTRRTRTRAELLEKAGEGEAGRRLLMHLSGQGIGGTVTVRLISLDDDEQSRVDLVHEALTHEWLTMREWLTERRKELLARADLARNVRRWAAQGRPWRGLPGGSEAKWMANVEAENDEQRAYQRAVQRLNRLRTALMATVLMPMSAAALTYGIWYLQSQIQLRRSIVLAKALAVAINTELRVVPEAQPTRVKLIWSTSSLLQRLTSVPPQDYYREQMLDVGTAQNLSSTVISVSGNCAVAPQTRCNLRVTHTDMPEPHFECQAHFTCGEITLYGDPAGRKGWSNCTFDSTRIKWNDASPTDGDPALVFDTQTGMLEFWTMNDGCRIKGRFQR